MLGTGQASSAYMFKRNKENFICEICGAKVEGNGYTNHCPQCLWSKHVDVHPGDRAAACGGQMRPVDVETKAGEHVIVHTCVICGHTKKNKVSTNDDFDAVIRITKREG